MKGDFTRFTHHPAKHFRAVLQQQGRVALDADWNEEVAIRDRIERVTTADVIGACGVPEHGGGFALGLSPDGLDLTLSPGRIYVDGILCELEAAASYATQPDWPAPEPLSGGAARTDLVYLDVWERHVSAAEDPELLDPALNGLDTTTRVRTVWQVKVLHDVGADAACAVAFALPAELGGGLLSVDAIATPQDGTPCVVVVAGGYSGVENRLYRVEIHDPGALGAATWKWSRDNGAVVFPVEELIAAPANRIRLAALGRDRVLTLHQDDWVELLDDASELGFQPGFTARVDHVDEATRIVTLDRNVPAGVFDPARHARLRRWDQVLNVDGDGVLATAAGPLDLEDGIQVRFGGADYRSGDYWTFAARVAGGTVESQTDAPAQGIRHHYCKLGLVQFDGTHYTSVLSDCRPCFAPLAERWSFFYAGGAGQEAMPGAFLPCALQVGLRRGCEDPANGALVQFRVAGASGGLAPNPAGIGAPSLQAAVGDDGIAQCFWRLPEDTGKTTCLRVEAQRLDENGAATGPVIAFNANLSVAREVGYVPPDDCADLAQAKTVQEAIDALCAAMEGGTGAEKGIQVRSVMDSTGKSLQNDEELLSSQLARGLQVECSGPVSAAAFERSKSNHPWPTFTVSLALPYPVSSSDTQLWGTSGTAFFGFQPILLDGSVAAEANRIRWTPSGAATAFLLERLFGVVEKFGVRRILCRLRLQENFIWSPDGLFLDGEVFAETKTVAGQPVHVTLPSGDGRRGGDLEMWFWLVAGGGTEDLVVNASSPGIGTVSGNVRETTGAPVPGAAVSLIAPSGATLSSTLSDSGGNFRFFVPNLTGQQRVVATLGSRRGETPVFVGG